MRGDTADFGLYSNLAQNQLPLWVKQREINKTATSEMKQKKYSEVKKCQRQS